MLAKEVEEGEKNLTTNNAHDIFTSKGQSCPQTQRVIPHYAYLLFSHLLPSYAST